MATNGHNNEYIVLLGNERHRPDLHQAACKNRYTNIAEARKFAKLFVNSYIFKLHWAKDCDVPEISWIE